MRPIMQAVAAHQFRRVVMVMGAQLAKTEGLLNVMGHRLDDDPCPVLYISPTQRQAESISRDRLMKMVRSTPSLWAKLSKGQSNKIGEKWISGVRLGFGWAGSATELSSHPAGLVLVDERDRMTSDTGGEGDPVSLAEARTATFPDGKVVVCSTPTLEGGSPIWSLFEEGTQHRWAWPCPDCGGYFVPRFELLRWPEDATPHQALRRTRLACPECGSELEDVHRSEMNRQGLFLAPGQSVVDGEIVGAAPESDTASFWVSGLASPWRTWGQRAKAFLEAKRSRTPGRIQAVINTQLGELYKLEGEAPDWQQVAELRGGYASGSVPEGVHLLTAGVDVQKDRLVYVVRGWGANSESWLVEAGELWGETQHGPVWDRLAQLLTRDFQGLQIRRMFVDSGYNPGGSDNMIYVFCRRHRSTAFPCKGHDRADKPLKAAQIDVTAHGKVIKGGLQLWHLDSDYFKSWVHARIEWPPGEPGAFHLPMDASEDYCKQLVAESRLVLASGRVQWIRTRKDNHYLDCEALNVAAGHSMAVFNLKGQPRRAEATTRAPRRRTRSQGFAPEGWAL